MESAAPDQPAPTGGPAPSTPPVALLDEEGEHDVAKALQAVWDVDAYRFLIRFAQLAHLDEGIPVIAGRALKAWAWFQSQPDAHGSIRAQDTVDAAEAEAAARAQDTRDLLSDAPAPPPGEPGQPAGPDTQE
jgi:hypothetical protein